MDTVLAPFPKLGNAQKKIFNVFLQLIEEKEIEKITVTEICEKADINRSTFYNNYYDIYDLKEKIGFYFTDSLVSFWVSHNFGLLKDCGDFSFLKDTISEFDGKIYVTVLNMFRNDKVISERLYNKFFSSISNVWEFSANNKDIKKVLKFLLNGSIFYCLSDASEFNFDFYCEFVKIGNQILTSFMEKNSKSSDVSLDIKNSKKYAVPIQKKKERLSVMKTKRSLRSAFLELCRNKKSGKITVSELCTKAEISHSTFYNHYASIDSFIDTLKNEITNTALEIAIAFLNSMNNGILDIDIISAFVKEMQKKLFDVSLSDKIGYNFPIEFSSKFYKYLDREFDCDYDGQMALDLICCCAYCSLFQSCDGENLPLDEVIAIAYNAVMFLFKKKE